MDEEDTKGFCRGCLKYCDEFMELLQYTEKNRRLFVYATGLQVKRNDTFKFQICKDCYLNMKIASKFKKQCRISDRRFKNFLALKGDDDNLDFKTFLRDNPVELKLPANSTPAHNKTRDEDDSIRNFITDMLQNEEIPDTESVIIRQVLEEETDVLEHSLDSHWLEDDISIASDLSLLTGFKADSVKSTRSANKKENIERNERFLAFEEFLVPKNKRPESMKTQPNLPENVQQISTTADIIDNELSNGLNTFSQKRVVLKKDKNISTFNIKIDQTTAKKGSKSKVIKKIENGHMFVKSNTNSDKDSECTIDRNLEMALKDEGIHEFSLENLLGPPKDLPEPSTPLISNIIPGGNVYNENDSSSSYSTSNAGKFIEKYKVVEGDTVLDDYFRKDSSVKDGSVRKKIKIIENKIINEGLYVKNHKISNEPDTKEPIQKPKELELNADDTLNCDFFEEIQNETLISKKSKKQKVDYIVSDDSKFCLKSFHCKLCNIKYKHEKALKIHFCRTHKIQIKKANKKNSIKRMCPKCGMEVYSFQMKIHLNTHMDRSAQCDICKRWFTTKRKLTHHMSTHYLPASERRKIADKKKEFLCTICGAKISTYRNYVTHQQRHTKEYTKWCNICGMGFITNYDLSEHSAKHSRDKPYLCNLCPKRYSRQRCLNKHLGSHIDTNLFECKYCLVTLMNWDSVKRHMTSQICLKLRRELGLENEDYFEAMKSYNRKQLHNGNCDQN